VGEAVESEKQNNKGKLEPIYMLKMHHSVRDDLLRYIKSGLKAEKAYLTVLEMCKRLAERNPEAYKLDLAISRRITLIQKLQ
jgi:hypothetical protein